MGNTIKITIEDFAAALKNKKPKTDLTEMAVSLLSDSQNEDRVLAARAAIYLHQFHANDGKYDKLLIEHYMAKDGCGLLYSENPTLFLELSKILARLFFKYGKYRQAGNFILFLSENTDENKWPDWLSNYRAVIELKTNPEFCFLCPNRILSKIPIGETNDRQRIAIYKEFLRQAYFYHVGKDKQDTAAFMENVAPSISEHINLFVDEWDSLSRLVADIKSAPIENLNADMLRKINRILQVDITRLNQELRIRDAQIDDLHEQLKDAQKKLHTKAVEQVRPAPPGSDIEYEPKILILGASMLSDMEITKTIENHFGLSRKSIEIKSDYQKNKRFDVSSLQYNSQYDGILVGPVAHSVCGKGDHTSVIQTLQDEGYPPFQEIRTKSGELRITKTALKEAMERLLNKIQTITPNDARA